MAWQYFKLKGAHEITRRFLERRIDTLEDSMLSYGEEKFGEMELRFTRLEDKLEDMDKRHSLSLATLQQRVDEVLRLARTNEGNVKVLLGAIQSAVQ